jgi:hypothetical protein
LREGRSVHRHQTACAEQGIVDQHSD